MDLFDLTPPRKPSAAEDARFRAAFARMLAEDPDTPPGPKGLADAMGWSNRQLNGRTTKLRRRLLREAGFRQGDRDGRWSR